MNENFIQRFMSKLIFPVCPGIWTNVHMCQLKFVYDTIYRNPEYHVYSIKQLHSMRIDKLIYYQNECEEFVQKKRNAQPIKRLLIITGFFICALILGSFTLPYPHNKNPIHGISYLWLFMFLIRRQSVFV